MGSPSLTFDERRLGELEKYSWQHLMEAALIKFLDGCPTGNGCNEHYKNTPKRVIKTYVEAVSGIGADIRLVLGTTFPIVKSEMIVLKDLEFVSLCSHHLMPFYGKAHFGYIPKKQIVGLSKIPRLVQTLSRMPRVQEEL
ncbi:MAG TPA: GTP cyclohydrolase I, partial [Nitrosopumilaceae archaeon]|nr:GTP cyclohydrolase I [Nitrosopumilaceae archaeon]